MLAKLSENRMVRFFASDAVALAFKVAYLLLAFLSFNSLIANMPPVTYSAYIVVVFGALVLVARLVSFRRFKDMPLLPLLLLFAASFVLSAVLSARYGILENAQGFIWLTLEFGCLYLCDVCASRKRLKHDLAVFAGVFVGYTLVASSIGLYMAFANYQDGYEVRYMVRNIVGIFQGRLFGLYSDPNYGAVYGLISMLFGWWLFALRKVAPIFLIASVNTLIQLFYIGLTGSRTGVYGSMVLGAFLAILFFCRLLKKDKGAFSKLPPRLTIACVLAVLVAVGVFGCFKGVERLYLSVISFTEVSLPFPVPNDYLYDRVHIYESPETIKQKEKEEAAAIESKSDESSGASQGEEDRTNPSGETVLSDEGSRSRLAPEEVKARTQGVGTEKIGLSARIDVDNSDVSNGRFSIWQSALEVFASSPVVGASHRHISDYAAENLPDTYIVKEGYTTMHNVFMDILAGQGVLGLLPMAVFIVCAIRIIACGLMRQVGLRYYESLLLIGVLFSIAFSAMFYSEILYINTVGSVVFWVVLGTLLALFRQDGVTALSFNSRKGSN